MLQKGAIRCFTKVLQHNMPRFRVKIPGSHFPGNNSSYLLLLGTIFFLLMNADEFVKAGAPIPGDRDASDGLLITPPKPNMIAKIITVLLYE